MADTAGGNDGALPLPPTMGPTPLGAPGPATPPMYEVPPGEGAAAFSFPGAGGGAGADAGGATEPAGAGGANPGVAFGFPPGPQGPVPGVALPGSHAAGMQAPPDPLRFVNEACAGKTVISAIGGGVLGVPMGVLISAYQGLSPPIPLPGQPEAPKIPLQYQLRDSMTSTKVKCIRWSKNFAVVTAVFSGVECTIEKVRAKHDVVNSVAAGCVTGAALAAKQGPGAMALGCGGFAAFSYIIDKVMGTH